MPRNTPHFWLATWFGTGLAPKAPGTVGTLATVPVHFLLIQLPTFGHLTALVILTILGTYSANKLAQEMDLKDPQIVVVDESAGVLLALFLIGTSSWVGVIAAIVLFRILDMTKPWPISAAENLKPAGIGIMADDLVAGLAAGILVRLAI
ncbi:MAG: phosphatidylglycerophosphatase A [Rhizobiaceae bacterium]|nr:phosphatidylglycerophosphatase A [Rhizobiaceae bacterium]